MQPAHDDRQHDVVAARWGAAGPSRLAAPLALVLLFAACAPDREVGSVKATVARYNELLRDGYQRQNMNFMREAASEEQATKLYSHMAALAEGGLRMNATLRELQFVGISFPGASEARAETREVWDFTHFRIATGEKYAEEKGFVYRMAYRLGKQDGRWIVVDVQVLSGESTNATIPWPPLARPGEPAPPGRPPPR